MKIEATSFRVKVALIIIYGTAGKNVIRSALRKYTPKNALPNVAKNLFGKNSNPFFASAQTALSALKYISGADASNPVPKQTKLKSGECTSLRGKA